MTIERAMAAGADAEIAVQVVQPAAGLRRLISGYHFYTLNFAPGAAHDDLFYRPGAISASIRVIGAGLTPLGWTRLRRAMLGAPAQALHRPD